MTTAQVLIPASSLAPNDVKSNQKQETGNQKLKRLHYPENLATGMRRPKTKSEKHKNYCISLKVKNWLQWFSFLTRSRWSSFKGHWGIAYPFPLPRLSSSFFHLEYCLPTHWSILCSFLYWSTVLPPHHCCILPQLLLEYCPSLKPPPISGLLSDHPHYCCILYPPPRHWSIIRLPPHWCIVCPSPPMEQCSSPPLLHSSCPTPLGALFTPTPQSTVLHS